MCELIGIELLFDRWLKGDMHISRSLDDAEKRRYFELFGEVFFWAWTQDTKSFQRWLDQKASSEENFEWRHSDAQLIPGQGLVRRGPLGW